MARETCQRDLKAEYQNNAEAVPPVLLLRSGMSLNTVQELRKLTTSTMCLWATTLSHERFAPEAEAWLPRLQLCSLCYSTEGPPLSSYFHEERLSPACLL